ncbi:ABC transporter permease subunit [Pseudonocardia humida]|uniref:ABC transporter permease subunit n=1 Tax=Pseudonocardia humida TaxID=2800819 RepID=A0ABT1A221_9PSEU|nr:ABC transporter permease subunit [Pseudonocardia humida]MCO1657006.1 ABC transporter permease subunit [Pseudonocardia humida]
MSTHPAFADTLRGEWIKFRSLRSTWLTLGGLVVIGLGITVLSADASVASYPTATVEERQDWDPTNRSLLMYMVAQLVIGVLGILVVTSEYATGLMQTSLSATPRRHRLLGAKVAVVTAVAVVSGQVLMLTSFLIGQARFVASGLPYATLDDPRALSAVVGGGLYLAVIGLLTVGLGTIMRATAGALATLVGIVLLVPPLADLFPWLDGLFAFWPTLGGAAVMETVVNPDHPHPWLNLAGMGAGALAVLAVAFVLFERRDV